MQNSQVEWIYWLGLAGMEIPDPPWWYNRFVLNQHPKGPGMSRLRDQLSQYWQNIQGNLFPWLREELGELTEKQQQLVTTLEVARVEELVPGCRGWPGRPPSERGALARAFVGKAVYNLSTTRMLIDRLSCDKTLRRICGWERKSDILSR